MTIREAVYEVRYLMANYFLVEESRISLSFTLHLINAKRGRALYEYYNRHKFISPQVVQNMGIYATTKVDMSNELDSQDCSCSVARIVIPPIVNITDDKNRMNDIGIHRIKSTCGLYYNPTTRWKLITMFNTGDVRQNLPLYFREGNAIYCHPWREEINPYLVLENPKDGFVIRPDNVTNGQLIPGESYTIYSGNITYNTGSGNVVLQRGDTFTANLTPGGLSWTGSGVVRFTNKRRTMTYDDEYAIDTTIWHTTKELVKKDLADGKVFIADVVNDGAEEEALQQSGK